MLDEEIKEFFKISMPLIVTRFIGLLTSFFSMLMLSRSSIEAAASCALISSLIGFYVATTQAMLSPVGIQYSMNYAQKELRKMEAVFLNGLLITLLLFLLWIALIVFTPYIGHTFTIDKHIISYVRKYFLNITPGIACSLVYFLCSQLLVAQNKQFKDTLFALVGCIVFGLSFFIFQMKNHDIYTAITNSTNISSAILLSLCLYNFKEFKSEKRLLKNIDLSLFKLLIKSGLIIFTHLSGELVAFTTITLFLGALGSHVLIAQRELTQISIIYIISAAAMGQAASIMVAKKKPQLDKEELRRFVRKVLFFTSVIYILSLIVLITKGISCLSMISRELISKKMLLIFSLTIYLDTFRHISSGILRGLENYKLSTFAGLFGLWGVCMPCLFLLSCFNLLTFQLSRILLLIGILIACLIQLKGCLVYEKQF